METNEEVAIVDVQGTELQILREKAQIDIQVSTARAYPRNVSECLKEAIFTATMDYETADSCTFALPRAGKIISGPSVRLAEIILQSWGNMRSETKVVEETDKHVVSESFSWDLQKNNAVKVTVKKSILQNVYENGRKTGKMTRMNEDMVTLYGNVANSIALRNSIFKVIPRAITDKVYQAVQVKIIGGEGEFENRLSATFKGFLIKYGKNESEVLGLISKSKLEDVTPGDLAVLIGIGTSLKNGDLTIESLFKQAPKTPEQKKSDLKQKQELDHEKLKEDISYQEESKKIDSELAAKENGIQGKIDMP